MSALPSTEDMARLAKAITPGPWKVSPTDDTKGQCPPPNMRIGKKRAGRLLDGRTWDEMPGVSHD